jgi:hypothetical protein
MELTLDRLAEENPDALLADGFEEALVGVCRRFGQNPLAAYDYDKCIEILMRDMSYEEAVEYFEFNVIGAYVGENTPVFLELES